MSHSQGGHQPPAIIFENARMAEFSPPNHRSETFSFPAPSVKAPPPPDGDQASSSIPNGSFKQRALRKTQSNPVSTSSLPNILDEMLYEAPKTKSNKVLNPAPYSYFVATSPSSSKRVPSETELDTSSVFPAEINGERMDEKIELNTVPQVKAKTRVSRLQSDPLRGNSSDNEYTDPQETRARFYSYTGMRMDCARSKFGALKKPMPLPATEDATENTGPSPAYAVLEKSTPAYAILEKPSNMKVSELESTLDSIAELDEILDDQEQESLSRSSSHKRHKLDLNQ